MKPEPNRDDVLRQLLVSRVDQTPRRDPSRRRPWLAVATAFAAGAVLAGGGVSAAAMVADRGDAPSPAAAFGRSFVGSHDRLVGEPFELTADQDAGLTVGGMPPGATALVLAVSCAGDGKVAIAVDGVTNGSITCDEDGSGTTSYARLADGIDSHELEFEVVDGSSRFWVWAPWVEKQEDPDASDGQAAALADGVVTHEEYLAAFQRFADCMAEAGFDIHGEVDGRLMSYSVPDAAVLSGDDHRCYGAEFLEVDVRWQGSGG
jgi:hypothetical protein